jgi:tetratricopeptide (TPR) repeat protein
LPAARKALELDPGLAEAHASLGMIHLNCGELGQAQQELRRALALNPGYGMAHIWLGLALTAQGRHREAAASNREAYRLDPLSPIVNCNVGFDALRFGDYDEARARFATAMEIDASFLVPYTGMARLESLRGRPGEALLWMDRALERAPTRAYYHAGKGLLLLQLGQTQAATVSIETARRIAGAHFFDSDLVVALYMARQDRAALAAIARGEGDGNYTKARRAQAHVALGELDAARNLYAEAPPRIAEEIDAVLRGDWFWRLPHAINYAHLRLAAGDDDARGDLEQYLVQAERVRAAGIVGPEIRYRVAVVQALLGREDQALAELEAAIGLGWRDTWWAGVDWNAKALSALPRGRELLDRAHSLRG